MGIKDKVLDILFDDDEQENSQSSKPVITEKKNFEASSFLDTGSIFIDATSPLPKTNKNNNQPTDEKIVQEAKPSSDYQFSENISPIFGVLDSKNKKSKNIAKVKSFNDLSSKKSDLTYKNQSTAYTSVVISPIFGPITTKPLKKSSKPRKKSADPFDRDISDTGNFDAILDENDIDEVAPDFEEVVEEIEVPEEVIGDTDRLIRISDKINKIKNEAANIYDEEESEDESIEEDGYQVETIEHKNISDLIHSVQNYDGKVDHTIHPQVNEAVAEQAIDETTVENEENISHIEEYVQEPKDEINDSYDFKQEENGDIEEINAKPAVNASQNVQTSIDDIFQDEDDVEEGKDLFSVLFGDE